MDNLPSDYKNQQVISLSRLNLSSLPDDMFDNNWQVQVLDLSFNQLTNLPTSIGTLSNLRELWLNNNKLVNLPETMTNLINLRRLDISHNELVNLYEFLPNTDISILDTSFNQLVSLPNSIGNLQNLHILHAQHNQINNLPTSLYDIKSLQVLNLCENNQLGDIQHISQYFPILNEFWF